MFEFPAFLPPTNLALPMHSPSALTEHVSLNLARFFLLDPVYHVFQPSDITHVLMSANKQVTRDWNQCPFVSSYHKHYRVNTPQKQVLSEKAISGWKRWQNTTRARAPFSKGMKRVVRVQGCQVTWWLLLSSPSCFKIADHWLLSLQMLHTRFSSEIGTGP